MIDDERDMLIALIGQDYDREVAKGTMLFKLEHGPDTEHFRYVWTNKDSWNAGQWYQFVVTLDSNNHANNMMAVDGVNDTSVLVGVPDTVKIDMSYDADIYIGGKDGDTAQLDGERFFQGVLDDVRLYNVVLSPDQISSLYTTGDEGGASTTYEVRWEEQP